MIRVTSGILMIIGLVAGTFTDHAADTPVVTRGGYDVVEADFHVHSFLGDGMLSPFALVSRARHQGLHAFAITDHNRVFAAKAGRWYSRLVGGPTVLVGDEVTAPGFHLIAVGIDSTSPGDNRPRRISRTFIARAVSQLRPIRQEDIGRHSTTI